MSQIFQKIQEQKKLLFSNNTKLDNSLKDKLTQIEEKKQLLN